MQGAVLSHMHGGRLVPHAWGPSCPTCKGPSCPTCKGAVLSHMQGAVLSHMQGAVLSHMHGGRLVPHALRACMQNTMYAKHNVPTVYCLTCQMINNIMMSPIKSMIVVPFYNCQTIGSERIILTYLLSPLRARWHIRHQQESATAVGLQPIW